MDRQQGLLELRSEVANLRITREEDGRYIKRIEAELDAARAEVQRLTRILDGR